MKIIFVTNNNIGSIVTRWFTWSTYSHVVLAYRDRVISADFFEGVKLYTTKDFLIKYKKIQVAEVLNVDEDKAWQFALHQVGKPYDYLNILGIFFKRDWTNSETWMCSELTSVALHEGGVTLIKKSANRVTPEDLLNSPLVNLI